MAKKQNQTFGQMSFLSELNDSELDTDILFPNDNRFNQFIKDWKACKYFALDIETQGITDFSEALDPYRGKIRLVQIQVCGKPEVLIVDFQKEVPLIFLDTLKSTCESLEQHQVGHNIQFDLTWLQHHLGIESNRPFDTRIMSILNWCGIKWTRASGKTKRMSHSLGDLYERLFNEPLNKDEQTSDWSQAKLTNDQLNYAASDVRATTKCFGELTRRILSQDNMKDLLGYNCRYSLSEVVSIECWSIPFFVEIYLTGQPIDLDKAKEVRQQYIDAIDDIYKPVDDVLGLPYSASSAKLCSAIWDKLGIALIEEIPSYLLEEDENATVKFTQMSFWGKKPPKLEKNQKLSTSSANLFYWYLQTNNDLLLRISLCRSLKKCVDSLDALVKSAEQNNGYAKGGYTSLGSTGSGRSTCSSLKNSNLEATNLQNIAGEIIHPIVAEYNLPPVRSIISNQTEKGLWLVDLSALI